MRYPQVTLSLKIKLDNKMYFFTKNEEVALYEIDTKYKKTSFS